jgi:hypothetical protein
MLSRTSSGAPAWTSSPATSGVATTRAGAGGRADDLAVVAADPVGHAVDLDQVDRAVRAGDQAETAAAQVDLPSVLVEPLQHRVDGSHVVPRDEPDAVAGRAGLGDGEPVGRAAQREVDRAAALVPHLRATAVRGGQQPLQLDLLLIPVGLDRRRGQRDTGVPLGHQPALGSHPVDPAGVGAPADHLGLVEQVEYDALVGGAALDEDGGLAHRAAQPGQRLVAVAAVGDDLGDH